MTNQSETGFSLNDFFTGMFTGGKATKQKHTINDGYGQLRSKLDSLNK